MKHTWWQQGNLHVSGFQWIKQGYLELVEQLWVHVQCTRVCVSGKVKLYPTLAVGTCLNLDLFVFLYFIPRVMWKSLRATLHRTRESGAEMSALRARELRKRASPAERLHHSGEAPWLQHRCPWLPGRANTGGVKGVGAAPVPPTHLSFHHLSAKSSPLPFAISAPLFRPLNRFLSSTSSL